MNRPDDVPTDESTPTPSSKPSGRPVPVARRSGLVESLRTRPRLTVAALVFGIMGAALVSLGITPVPALLLAFDAGALVFLVSMWVLFNTATPQSMRHQARLQDAGRWGILWSAVALTAVVVVALGSELRAATGGGVAPIVLAGGSIVLSWLFMNVMFALHYAHGFYGDYGVQHQGLDFPGKADPDYWDFAYFAIVIGMTFQVSDVQISSRALRRTALLHGVIAFFFNVFIIAVTVNIVAGQV